MNSKTFGIDRVVAALLGLVLVVGGAWVFAWAVDLLPQGWASPPRLVLGLSERYADMAWWPWLVGVIGLVLIVAGLAWFIAHFRSNRVSNLSLPGDGDGGRLLLAGGALATAASVALDEGCEDIADARGRLVHQGRRVVLDLTASVRPDANLPSVVHACDAVVAQALRVTGRQDVACRIRVKVAARGARPPRVH